jgi:hypothetical protein
LNKIAITYTEDSDNEFLAFVKVSLDLDSQLVELISSGGKSEIILGLTRLEHERAETIIRDINEGVLSTGDVGNIAIVRRRGQIFNLLVGEDIHSDEMALGMSVLAGFGGRDIYDLARAVLDDNVSVLTDRTSLHGEGLGGASIGRLEVNVMVLVVRHDEYTFCGGERGGKGGVLQ